MTLVGFSMGGGEVARYVGSARRGPRAQRGLRGRRAAVPALDDDNPDGALDDDTVAGSRPRSRTTRAFFDEFTRNFFSAGDELKVSEEQRQEALGLGLQADVHAARDCIRVVDHRLPRRPGEVTVPTLVIHGDSDGIVPFERSGKRTHEPVAGSELHVVEGGPHGINASHAEEFNRALLAFLER